MTLSYNLVWSIWRLSPARITWNGRRRMSFQNDWLFPCFLITCRWIFWPVTITWRWILTLQIHRNLGPVKKFQVKELKRKYVQSAEFEKPSIRKKKHYLSIMDTKIYIVVLCFYNYFNRKRSKLICSN